MLHWLSQIWTDPSAYNFVSGPLPDVTLLGGFVLAFRKLNCHAPRCWRIGHHPTADGQFRLCRHHHPDLPNGRLSLAEIHRRHHEAKEHQ